MILTKENKFSWLRQDKEPEATYKWFTYYRDMKGTRRLKKVIQNLKEKEPYLERYPTYNEIKNASSTWKWKQRTIDYDNYMQIQLIESHKQTLVIYEEESINIDKKIYNALNTEIDHIIKNKELTPDKKIKALREAQHLNKELLDGIEHIANIEVPKIQYIDMNKTREQDIINTLIGLKDGYLKPEDLNEILDGYEPEDVEDLLKRHINEKEANSVNTYLTRKEDNIRYNNKSYTIPR